MKWCRGVLACFALFAFDVRGQAAAPIVQPGHPWAFDGFSVTPPIGEWASFSKTRTRAVFVKRPRGDGGATVATVNTTPHEQDFASGQAFLEYMRTQRGAHIDLKRFELLRHEEQLESAEPWCTRYSLLGADQASILAAAWFIEVFGRSCWHRQAKIIVDANVSERGLPGDSTEAAEVSIESFLSSLRLQPVEALGVDPEKLRAQAESGNTQAALRLASMYEHGRGVPTDRARAEAFYRQAADAGEIDAQFNLGLFYLRSATSQADATHGILWLMRAADQRDAQAQYNLGLIFFEGLWVEADFGQAYDWFRLAAANGHEKARAFLRPLPLGGLSESPPESPPQ
ncbi:MAG TPA: tetratricopeptide repeat protein [Burkholderiales bacterium]|nr:tetratricopeptide repeat protein [Burkholderiales bacterium]